jgi:ceramide glucosyltransferase
MSINVYGLTGEEVVGVNPKVNNLVRPYREAAHDILWVLDSNISVIPQTLGRSVDSLVNAPSNSSATKRRISLVHHVPYASYDEWSLGAAVESAFLNTNHAKMYVAINEVALESCVVGKSCLYRRSDIERLDGSLRPISSTSATSNSNSNLNSASSRPRSSSSSSLLTTSPTRGLPAFARFLAEDNMLASALWHELDTRHALGADVAHNAVGRMRLRDYVWRRVRWLRVRKRMTPIAATLAEPFTESVVLGMMVCASLWRLVGVNPVWVIVAHYMWWIAVDLDVYASLAGHPLPSASRVEFFAAWTIREALALPIWVLAMMGNTVEWRGTKYRILRNGEVAKAGKEKDSRERDGVVYERLSDA